MRCCLLLLLIYGCDCDDRLDSGGAMTNFWIFDDFDGGEKVIERANNFFHPPPPGSFGAPF